MSKVIFSPEQQQLLRDNPYTVRVTVDVLSLSREFKEIFYKEYLNGALPRDILQKYGYPIEILGSRRISWCPHSGSTRESPNPGGKDPAAGTPGKLSDPRG